MGAAIAEFNELEIRSIRIHVKKPSGKDALGIGEIVILGKPEAKLDNLGFSYGKDIAYEFAPYTAFEDHPQVTDEPVILDGVLDDEVWLESKNKVTIKGEINDQTTGDPIDVSIFGEREARVYTHIGSDKGYFAFEVKDKNLFLNYSQPQGRSTCVELYFTNSAQTEFKYGCYSIRINPTGLDGDAGYRLGVYSPNTSGNEWMSTTISGKVDIAVKVDGKVQLTAKDDNYSSDDNTGYVVEVAIDKSLIGIEEDTIRFTAAFVQDQGYDLPRLGNSFIEGTHYMKPATWIVMSNDGISHE
jgi:uncharacterized protein YdeI (BOF family)